MSAQDEELESFLPVVGTGRRRTGGTDAERVRSSRVKYSLLLLLVSITAVGAFNYGIGNAVQSGRNFVANKLPAAWDVWRQDDEADARAQDSAPATTTLKASGATPSVTTDSLQLPSPSSPPSPSPAILSPAVPSPSPVRYLSYQAHSGFHNQRMELSNAITMALLLNRTLLLPPMRVGRAIPWAPDVTLEHLFTAAEQCKLDINLGIPLVPHAPGESKPCVQARHWTYLPWSFLFGPDFLREHHVVDRWNTSRAWLADPQGLGVPAERTFFFPDPERRTYRVVDTVDDDRAGGFSRTLSLDQLRSTNASEGGYGNFELLHFGSMYASSRLRFREEGNLRLKREVENGMLLGNKELAVMSIKVAQLMGADYVGVHARVGDGTFLRHAKTNMISVFERLCSSLNIPDATTKRLLASSAKVTAKGPGKKPSKAPASASRFERRALLPDQTYRRDWTSDPDVDYSYLDTPLPMHQVTKHSRRAAIPVSTGLKCRGPLHTEPDLLALNTPIYLATDSSHPTSAMELQALFQHFPCTFILSDFMSSPGEFGVEVVEIGHLKEWKNEWDGMALEGLMFPFLEAQIVARGRSAVGTAGSTFSYYATGLLFNAYQKERAKAGA